MRISSVRLPFRLEADIPTRCGDVELELRLEATAGEEGDDEEPLLQACDEVVRLFALSVGDQLFRSSEGPAGKSSLELLGVQSARKGGSYVYKMRARALPANAFLVLLGMLAQNTYAGDPLERVKLHALHPSHHSLGAAQLLSLERVVAQRHPFLPFELRYAPSEQGTHLRTITYEFSSPLPRQAAEEVQEMLNRWDHLMVLGGFQLDFSEIVSTPDFGTSAHVAPATLEHRVPDFQGDESAFETLVNLGVGLNARGLSLRALTIE